MRTPFPSILFPKVKYKDLCATINSTMFKRLLSLKLSATDQEEPSIVPFSCSTPQQPTIYYICFKWSSWFSDLNNRQNWICVHDRNTGHADYVDPFSYHSSVKLSAISFYTPYKCKRSKFQSSATPGFSLVQKTSKNLYLLNYWHTCAK